MTPRMSQRRSGARLTVLTSVMSFYQSGGIISA
jgi:hypothetical protein